MTEERASLLAVDTEVTARARLHIATSPTLRDVEPPAGPSRTHSSHPPWDGYKPMNEE
jgi:hypothetical protein